MKLFTWNNEVRAHEIDIQGIVNNAHYLSYFDHARTLHLQMLGLDWSKLSLEGFNLVLIETRLQFLQPLRAFQKFTVNSEVLRSGKLKLVFNQDITSNNKLVCKASSTVVCVTGNKPIALDTLGNLSVLD